MKMKVTNTPQLLNGAGEGIYHILRVPCASYLAEVISVNAHNT